MKSLNKIVLKIFSVIIILVSIILLLFVSGKIENLEFIEFLQEGKAAGITTGICIILVLLAINSLISSREVEDVTDGVLLENSNGKLFITKESIISMIEVEIKKYSDITSQNILIGFDDEKNLLVNLNLVVKQESNIKELSSKLQNSIKSAVKRSSDLDIKEIDIKIKNVQDEKNNN